MMRVPPSWRGGNVTEAERRVTLRHVLSGLEALSYSWLHSMQFTCLLRSCFNLDFKPIIKIIYTIRDYVLISTDMGRST
jgi:hypothetical protein